MLTGERPNVNASSRYSIGETCRLLGINRSTLHRYAQKGAIERGLHKMTMKPYYTGLAILKFWNGEMTADKSCGKRRIVK